MYLSPSLHSGFHRVAQDAVDARRITRSIRFQPFQNVSIRGLFMSVQGIKLSSWEHFPSALATLNEMREVRAPV
jgi:hypothetical protein